MKLQPFFFAFFFFTFP
ncbi:hypothetical protein [Jejubacter calystegiae]|nr:hypothetical protein [Jejubacter calystegiae]